MKSFLFKLLSIKCHLFHTLKRKEKQNNDILLNRTEQIESLPNLSVTENRRKILPLNQSANQSPCCRRKNKAIHQNDCIHRDQPLPLLRKANSSTHEQHSKRFQNLGIASHAIRDDEQSVDQTSTSEKQEFSMLPLNTGPDTKQLYNEMNIRELVNTVRTEIGALIDADRKNTKEESINQHFPETINMASGNQNINLSALKKKMKFKKKLAKKPKKKKQLKPSTPIKSTTESPDKLIPTEQYNNCCCNFLHYSLRQVMRDTEQMKQFVLNTSMIGLDPSKLKDPTNTLCPAICIPMYNCENIRDQRFPTGPTFTTISKTELTKLDDHSKENPMIIQTINTHRGPIQIQLDPQSFGLAPFFSDQYETFIKGPPNSIFFTSYMNTYHK